MGIVYGTIGVGALVLGGVLGGYLISRFGLKACLWPMMFAIHLPDLMFVYLATALPENVVVIATALAIEQFGYGCGFAAFMLYMMMVADGVFCPEAFHGALIITGRTRPRQRPS